MSKQPSVELICTDKGQHPRRNLSVLSDHNGQLTLHKWRYGSGALTAQGHGRRASVQRAGITGIVPPKGRGTKGTNLKCPTCNRCPALNTQDLEKLLKSGLPEVDISYLPH